MTNFHDFEKEGREAHAAGQAVAKCPYMDNERRSAWRLGWFEANWAAIRKPVLIDRA